MTASSRAIPALTHSPSFSAAPSATRRGHGRIVEGQPSRRREVGDASWGSHVGLSERFFCEATEAPVPLDLRVVRALRSPFEIDI